MTTTESTIILIGPPGSGKTTCGALLAQAHCLKFVDSDQIIEEKTKLSVADIFANHGEAAFRKMERQFLDGLIKGSKEHAQGGNLVIATGGGLPVANENWQILTSLGKTIYLKASPQCLAGRLAQDETRKERPLLKNDGQTTLVDRLAELLGNRSAVYERALYKVDTENLTPQEVVLAIAALCGIKSQAGQTL